MELPGVRFFWPVSLSRESGRWLKQYLPLAEEGIWAWLDICDSGLFAEPPVKDV